jgi:hypothetical protein
MATLIQTKGNQMAHWLGTWENKSADGVLSETWTKQMTAPF